MILGFAAPSEGYMGHKGYFTFVAVLAIIITTLLLIFALINLQATCCSARWLVVVSEQRNFDFNAANVHSRKCSGACLLLYSILSLVLSLQPLQNK